MDLVIYLIRSNGNDDVIKVRRRLNEGFILRYVDGTVPHTVWINEKNSEEIMLYLESILFFFKNDSDPFLKIQVSIPDHPVVFIDHSKFDDYFCDFLLMIIDRWVYTPATSFTQ